MFFEKGDMLSTYFSVAFSSPEPPPPQKEKHRIKDKGLCPMFKSTQETRHKGDGNSIGSRKLKQDVTRRVICPT